MTSRTRLLLLSALALLLAIGGWYRVQVGGRQEAEIAGLVQRTNRQRGEIHQLRAERDRLLGRISEFPAETPPAVATGDATFDRSMGATLARVEQLRRWLRENPAEQLPEFQFLQDTDWIDAVADNESELDLKSAARNLRFQAKANLAFLLHAAVQSYAEASGGRLPSDLAQLRPFLVFPVPEAMLARYEMRASGLLGAAARDLPIIGEKASAIAIASDRPFVLRPGRSSGLESFRESPFLYTTNSPPELAVGLSKANQAYRFSHDGTHPKSLADLAPHFENSALFAEFADLRAAKDAFSAALDEGMRGYAAANGGRKVTAANRADMLPFIRDPAVREILVAKDTYLRTQGQHPENSTALRPYVQEPAARALLERLVRAEAQLEGR